MRSKTMSKDEVEVSYKSKEEERKKEKKKEQKFSPSYKNKEKFE